MTRQLTQKTMQGASWIGGALILRMVVRIVVVAVLVRFITPEDYGIATIAFMAMEFAAMLYQLGLAPALTQRKEVRSDHFATALTISMIMACVISILLWLIAPFVASLMRTPAIEGILKIICFLSPFLAFNGLCEVLLARNARTRSLALRPLVCFSIAAFLVAIPLAYAGFGYWALIGLHIAEVLFSSVLVFFAARDLIVAPGFSLTALRELWPMSLRFSAIQPLFYLSANTEKILLGRLLGTQTLGLYSRASFLVTTATIFFNTMAKNTVFPAMSQIQDDPARLRNGYIRALALLSWLTWPSTVYCALFSEYLIRLLLGSGWSAAAMPFAILSVMFYFRFAEGLSAFLLQAQGVTHPVTITKIISVIMLGTGTIFAAPYGVNAVCIVVVLVCIMEFMLLFYKIHRLLDLNFAAFVRAHIPALLCAMCVMATGIGIRMSLPEQMPVAIRLLIAGGAAAGLILCLSRFKPEWFLGRYLREIFAPIFSRLPFFQKMI